jgi:hypothetical protein
MPLIVPAESRLLALERKHARILDLIEGMKVDAARAGQSLWDSGGSELGGRGAPPTPPANTTVNGVARSACAAWIVGEEYIPITVVITYGGSTLWTGPVAVSTGAYSASFYLDPSLGAVSISCTGTATGTVGARCGPATVTALGTGGQTFTAPQIQVPAATNYHCTSVCGYPLYKVLNVVAGAACVTANCPGGACYPSDTLTLSSLFGGQWIGAAKFAIPGIPAGGSNFQYVVYDPGTGYLRLNASTSPSAALGGGGTLATLVDVSTLDNCPSNANNVFQCHSVCPPKELNCTIHE